MTNVNKRLSLELGVLATFDLSSICWIDPEIGLGCVDQYKRGQSEHTEIQTFANPDDENARYVFCRT